MIPQKDEESNMSTFHTEEETITQYATPNTNKFDTHPNLLTKPNYRRNKR